MFPNIVIFNKEITYYNLMVIIGISVSIFYVIKICKNRNIDDYIAVKTLLIGALGAFIGSHLLYAITKIDLIIIFFKKINQINNFSTLINCIVEIFGGAVFYGGLIGGLIFSYLYLKKNKNQLKIISDLCTPVIPLFHFFGRIGCFLSGCCYGIESKFGFVYNHSLIESANGVVRFPIQLVESLYNLLLFLILFKLYKSKKFKDNLIYLYLMMYSLARFIFEFFRGDEYRGFFLYLSTSQIISIILFIYSFVFLLKYKQKK